jgi:hypothetical protein
MQEASSKPSSFKSEMDCEEEGRSRRRSLNHLCNSFLRLLYQIHAGFQRFSQNELVKEKKKKKMQESPGHQVSNQRWIVKET